MKRGLHKSNYISFLIPPGLCSTSAIALPSENLGNAKSMRLGKTDIYCPRPYPLCGIRTWLTWREMPEKVDTGYVSGFNPKFFCVLLSSIAPKLLLDLPKLLTSNQNYTFMYYCPSSYICKAFAIVLIWNPNVPWRVSLSFLAQSYLVLPTHQCPWGQGTRAGQAASLCSPGPGVKLPALPFWLCGRYLWIPVSCSWP